MKKEKVFLDNFVQSTDYKLEYVELETKRNFESIEKWLYLGADAKNLNFAKIGITMGDLSSRSYSSGNPNYYLFCAFKCKYNLSQLELKNIEEDILMRFEEIYTNDDGSTKRLKHYESDFSSECFYPVNFLEFFINLHLEIYQSHRNSFVICGFDDGFGGVDAEFIDCIFSPKIGNKNKYIKMILQY